jgi:hypothetical protein
MKIEAVSICVNYSDYLEVSLPINKKILDKIVIVTRSDDYKTIKVCKENNVLCIATDEFNNHPSGFNKFKGINKGLEYLDRDGWILFLDCDIVLDPLSRIVFDNLKLDETCLYGCDRVNCVGYDKWLTRKDLVYGNWLLTSGSMELGARICQYYGQQGDNGKFSGWKPLGFFQLAHNSSFSEYPTDTEGYDRADMVFSNQYIREKRVFIPDIIVIHLESYGAQMGDNWKGRVTLPFSYKKSPVKTQIIMYIRRLQNMIMHFFYRIAQKFQ